MKRHLLQAVVILVVLLAAAAAQDNPAVLKANIPFPFVVASHTLPAGHYTLSALGEHTIRVANAHEQGAFVLTSRVDGQAPEGVGRLVFYRYEDRYFLAQVWNPGNNRGKQVYKSGAEQELERKGTDKQVAVLRAEN